jgi:uncharacterized protein (TIGR02300 family)
VAKSELGTKRVCPETGRKFYDLNKTPVISPYTGNVVPVVAPAVRHRAEVRAAAPKEEVVLPETQEAEFVSLEDADAESQGKKTDAEATEGEDIELEDEPMDDATFIEETEEGDDDVTDIIGDVDDEEEA